MHILWALETYPLCKKQALNIAFSRFSMAVFERTGSILGSAMSLLERAWNRLSKTYLMASGGLELAEIQCSKVACGSKIQVVLVCVIEAFWKKKVFLFLKINIKHVKSWLPWCGGEKNKKWDSGILLGTVGETMVVVIFCLFVWKNKQRKGVVVCMLILKRRGHWPYLRKFAWCQFCFIDVDPLKFLVCKPKKKKRGLMKQKKVLGGRWEEKSRILEKF